MAKRTENHISTMIYNRICIFVFILFHCIGFVQGKDNHCYISYLAVRSAALDGDSCIFDAYEAFRDDSCRNHIALQDKFLYVHDYDSLVVTEVDSTLMGKSFRRIKNTSDMVKSMLGYNVSSEEEKKDMALILPAAAIYFEKSQTAKYLIEELVRQSKTLDDTTQVFVVVTLLKVFSNADLIADINRTAKIIGLATGGIGFITGAVVKKALKQTAGKGYSIIASNIIYRLEKDSMTLVNVVKTNNYGIITGSMLSNDKEKILYDATMKALSNTEQEIIRKYDSIPSESDGKFKSNRIKRKITQIQNRFISKEDSEK